MDDPVTRRYQPPFDEFQLEVLTVGAGGAYKVAASPGRRVVHVTHATHTPPTVSRKPPPPPPPPPPPLPKLLSSRVSKAPPSPPMTMTMTELCEIHVYVYVYVCMLRIYTSELKRLFASSEYVERESAGDVRRATLSSGPCVFLVQGGGGTLGGEEAGRGAVVYAAAGEEVEVRAGDEGCKVYRAMINSRVFE